MHSTTGAQDANPTPEGLAKVPAGKDHTLTANGIAVLFAARLAGAVYSMTWKGHEFVQALPGNGGSQQSALAYDLPLGETPEVENPTEAGSWHDGLGKTTSRWTEAAASDAEMYTKCQMAYFFPPGEIPFSSARRTVARGVGPVSDTWLTKRVSIGWRGFPNVVNYRLKFECPSPHWFTQVEVLTGYMPRAFGKMYVVEAGGRPRALPGGMYVTPAPSTPLPIIVAKTDDVALGVLAYAAPSNGTYPWSPWYMIDAQSDTAVGTTVQTPAPMTKWNVVWHGGSQLVTTKRVPASMTFGVALVIGSVAQCAGTIAALQRAAAA